MSFYLKTNKNLILLILLFALLSFARSFAAQEIDIQDLEVNNSSSNKTLSMNLNEAILIGLRNSRQIKITYLDRVLEKFDLARSRSEFQPNITLEGDLNISASRTDTDYEQQSSTHERQTERSAEITPKLRQKLPTGGELTLEYAWGHNTDWREEQGDEQKTWANEGRLDASFSQPLLKGAGVDYNTASLKKNKLDSQEAILRLRDDISSQVQQIISTYNSLWSAQENLQIARNSLKESRKQLEINRLLIETGRKPESDIYEAEANVARQELSHENALNSLEQARLDLLDILDLDQDYELTVTEDYAFSPRDPKIKRCLKIAQKQNSKIVNSKHAVLRNELDLMQAKRDELWDLSLDAGYTRTGHDASGNTDNFDKDHWQVGLNLNIPFYFWGEDKYNDIRPVLQARIALHKARLNHKEAQEDLYTQILNKVRNVRHAAKKVDLSRNSLELTQKNYKMDELKLRLGRISNNDFINSQERLSDAQKAEVEAIISYLSQANDLDMYLGTLLETYEIPFENSRPALEKKYLQDKTWMLD